MKNKKFIIIILLVIVVFTITRRNRKDTTVSVFEGNRTVNQIVVEKITFANITKIYNDGVTTIRADVINHTRNTVNANVKVSVMDKNGNEVAKLYQIIENLEPDSSKKMSTAILGNYESEIYEIKIDFVSDEEIEEINK